MTRRGQGALTRRLARVFSCAAAGLLAACSPTATSPNTSVRAPASPSVAAATSSARDGAGSASGETTTTPPQAVATPADLSQQTNVALVELGELAVKGRAPMTGYSRDQFGPAWPTIDGCDERNDTLRRDLTDITLKDSCEVASGTLVSPYSGTTIHFVRGPESAEVQIDHVVALGDAWQTGAQSWTPAQREAFANDPIELLAVDAHSNEQKGDADAASWLPSNKAFRCTYVSMQVNIKDHYHLWVTSAEHDAIAAILSRCAPQSGGTTPEPPAVVATPPAPTTVPTTLTPTPAAQTTASATRDYVTPGAFCSTAGATGVSKTGKPEVCKTSATDSRLRWRAA